MPVIPEDGRDAAPQVLAPVPSSAERRSLRARAHALDPVVRVGDAGLTDAVIAETDRALAAHGLIKVRVAAEDRSDREGAAAMFERRLGCAVVQSIGKILVLWRPRPDEGADTPAPRPTPRRRVVAPPKKLAALGKPAPARKSRPAPPARAADAPPAKRRGPPPPGTHPVGPGIRTTRGALDTSARPAGAGRGASKSTGTRGTASPATARPSTSRPSDARPSSARASAARPASPPRAPTRAGSAPRGAPSPARPASGV
ncbi:MAG: YhbY family RNA-binding protein, partial [Burkholderiaceae bacterium]